MFGIITVVFFYSFSENINIIPNKNLHGDFLSHFALVFHIYYHCELNIKIISLFFVISM